MKPILIQLGALQVSSYILMLALGGCALLWLTLAAAERQGLPTRPMIVTVAAIYLSSLAGARILFVLESRDQWQGPLGALFSPVPGGFLSYGGLLGGSLALFLCARFFQLPLGKPADSMAVGLCAFAVFGRLGCFLAGCCHGRPTSAPWGIVFPEGSDAAARFGRGVAVHPTQLYDAVVMGALAVMLARKPLAAPGGRFLWLMLAFGALRFLTEFFRGDLRSGALGLSTAQWVGAALVMVSAGLLETRQLRKRLIYGS
ncbi:MAG: prolipoprotein diacylglyceryl transferase [Acidobacteria bacterium]|nr:prolipoprotein diacylglyceryl transferase [Acidobacteriota bacterium]